ncbi:MAG: hypothetical protein P4L43_08320 [Syntrophobacteraceae bacterium]|nr:hypothetical protein [Syntrophobacteraceae bacterium]
MNEDTEQRIVALYTGGQSIESITREVGRARYLVVHVLQSKGVFGNRQIEPDCEEPLTEPVAVEDGQRVSNAHSTMTVEDKTEECVIKAPAPELVAVNEPRLEIAAKEPPKKEKRVRKAKSPEPLPSLQAKESTLKPAAPENSSPPGRWSPLLVDALYELVARQDIDTGMTLEDVRKMVSEPKR